MTGPGLYDQAAQLHRQRQEYLGRVAAGPELDHRLVDLTARRMCGVYDARNGGFGEEPKFPSAPILQFIIHLYRVTGEEYYRAMLEKTLNALLSGELFDGAEGGFFRYCAQADWTEAQHEKMVEDNIRLARVFMDAALILEREEYRATASGTIDYLLVNLWDERSGGFRGSQGAHSDYFALSREARQTGNAPPSDPILLRRLDRPGGFPAPGSILEAGTLRTGRKSPGLAGGFARNCGRVPLAPRL